MIRQLKKITGQMVAGANVATIFIMLLIGFSYYVNPVRHSNIANIGLAFPVFLLLNFGFLVFWLIFKPKWALIPFFGYVVCYVPVRTYIPINVSHDAPEGSIKILSYNVQRFVTWSYPGGKDNPILKYLIGQNPDIICLQETVVDEERSKVVIDSVLSAKYPYKKIADKGDNSNSISIYSKYPIIAHRRIWYESAYNLSVAYKIKIAGDTILVINNHLETTGLSLEDRAQFGSLVRGDLSAHQTKVESHRIINQLGDACRRRAPQADSVADFIKQNSHYSIICCGDFNDSPLSYTHHTVSKNLKDCYVESGNGPGISYHHSKFYVRIDNILCSKDWTSYGCKVDSKIGVSDHYPIYCWLKKR